MLQRVGAQAQGAMDPRRNFTNFFLGSLSKSLRNSWCRLNRLFFFALLLINLLGETSQRIFAQEPSELARVGILRFINNTQSENFGWVEQSLPDAIDLSMRARFEYVRLNHEQVQKAKDSVPPTEVIEGGLHRFSQNDAARIAQLSSADILIYGDFIADEANSEIVLRSVIFNAASGRVIGRVENRTPMNTRIFRNIDQMAAEIVSEIYRYALQENQNSARAKDNLKLLVLVPSYKTAKEERQAKEELEVLKRELSARTPGRYLTIFEFFNEYRVTLQEQTASLTYAKNRQKIRLQLWLEGYGVRDAMIVLVSENKVNITAIGTKKTAQVSYAISASPEEKAKQMEEVQEKMRGKMELVKSDGISDRRLTVLVGFGASRGILTAGNHLGLFTGANVHASYKLTRFWEPFVHIEGGYGLPFENVSYAFSGSILSGLSLTTFWGRFAVSPYLGTGLYAIQIHAKAGVFNVLLSSVGGGFSLFFMVTPAWGIALDGRTQYIFDLETPALFMGGSLATVLRF
ncbi:MAG: hypothetical protein LDLANPLL_02333 [Turneriella sp.]|nr:hypothetical protein [Turneriella sp.]